MIKTRAFSLLAFNRFEFGTQPISQFVIFEHKSLFSIIIFYFHKSEGSQDRFHTHAFNAISFKLWGSYTEHILHNEETGDWHASERTSFIKYFPRDSYHRIASSKGCCTVLLSGSWRKTWKEFIGGRIQHYSWGRDQQQL
jgi:hypothetical protein